jgi:hypothetical protein
MAVFALQIPNNPNVVFTTILDSVAYDIRLHWNTRDEAWYLYFGRQNNNFIFKTKITTNIDLLKAHRANNSCPKGTLVALDNMKFYGRITRDGWSSGRFSLYYVTEDSRIAVEDSNTSSSDLQITINAPDESRFTKSTTRL